MFWIEKRRAMFQVKDRWAVWVCGVCFQAGRAERLVAWKGVVQRGDAGRVEEWEGVCKCERVGEWRFFRGI